MKATLVLYTFKPLSEMVNSINWIRASGRYVLRDPSNKDLLLYLDEKHYNKLVITALSTDITLEVIADPDDTESTVKARLHFEKGDHSHGTPPLDAWFTKRSKVLSLISGWKIKESMIEFERNFDLFIPLYYRDVTSWFGLPLTRSSIKEIKKLSNFLDRILRYRSINQVILILKIQSIVVLQYIGGNKLTSTQELGQRIALVNGLPKAIPPYFRYFIRNMDVRRIRVLLTILQSYKGMRGKYGEISFSSIEAPKFEPCQQKSYSRSSVTNPFPFIMETWVDNWNEINSTVFPFLKEFNLNNIKPNLLGDITDVPFSLTAGPNSSTSFLGSLWDSIANIRDNPSLKEYHDAVIKYSNFSGNENITPYGFMKVCYSRFISEIESGDLSFDQFKNTTLFKRVKKTVGLKSEPPLVLTIGWLEENIFPHLKLGKLALKYEAAGKIRVFAISDYWTQWIMKPLHLSLFEILKSHPCDATFDQEGKVKEFQSRNYLYLASYDLKSATDLIPIQIYEKLIGALTSKEVSKAWVKALTDRKYSFFGEKGVYKECVYTRGQPMGTLSSWAGLALVHHFLIYLSAQRAKINNFQDYLVLGDDIVIGNRNVADQYVKVCEHYGITIGFPKSFISEIGLFQFASQNCVKGDNISPISLKEGLAVSGYSYYFGKDFNLAKTVEFVNRSIRKGFVGTNLLDLIRLCSTRSQWLRYSKLLTKGIFPFDISNMLVGLLSKDFSIFYNNSSLDQLIASIRGDIRLFTGHLKYSASERFKYQKLVEKLIIEQIEVSLTKLQDLEISKTLYFESKVLNDLYWRSTFKYRYNKGNSLIDLRRVFNKFKFIMQMESNMTPIAYFIKYPDQDEKMAQDLDRLNHLFKMKQEIDSLMINTDLIKSVSSSMDTKVPYQIKFHLSLLSQMKIKEGKAISN